MSLTGKHAAILGAGRSGRAAAALALRHGARVSVWDEAGPEVFTGLPEGVEIHPSATIRDGADAACDLLVVSPGIDTYGPYVAAFAARAIGQVVFQRDITGQTL